MRVLMVSANTAQITMPVLPLGLARVAAAVQGAGHEIRVLNLMRPEQVARELPGAIGDFEPEAIGISVRNIDDQNRDDPAFLLPRVKTVIDACRRWSAAPVVLGGPGYSIFPEAVLAFLEADYGIQGEGEQAMPLLLDRIRTGEPVKDIPGLILPGGDSGPPPDRSRSLDDTPLAQPGTHLVVPGDVDPEQLWVPFQTRIGCPMQCSYCSTPFIEGRRMRYQSPELVVKNLEAHVRAGYRRFFFVDNVFDFAESLDLDVLKLTCGLRIYPKTLLAGQAEARGLIASGADLLRPAFYLEPELDGWLQNTTARMVEKNDNWHT